MPGPVLTTRALPIKPQSLGSKYYRQALSYSGKKARLLFVHTN